MKIQKGQTLVEVLIGLAAAIVVMAAITIITITSLSNAQFQRDQDLANNYAQQGMEIVRNLELTDYKTFSTLSGTYCFAQSCNAIAGAVNDTGSACGQISFNSCPGTLNIGSVIRTVTLSWNVQRCKDRTNLYCHSVLLSSCFNNERIIPTP